MLCTILNFQNSKHIYPLWYMHRSLAHKANEKNKQKTICGFCLNKRLMCNDMHCHFTDSSVTRSRLIQGSKVIYIISQRIFVFTTPPVHVFKFSYNSHIVRWKIFRQQVDYIIQGARGSWWQKNADTLFDANFYRYFSAELPVWICRCCDLFNFTKAAIYVLVWYSGRLG